MIGYAHCMREMTDEQLMRRYAGGDADAFEQLYARHRGGLYRYFFRQVCDTTTANDLYQGTWEKIIRSRRSFRRGAPFTAWMYRIARNHLVDHYRRQRPVDNVEMDGLTGDNPGPSQHASREQRHAELRSRILALPREQRETLLLKLESGLKLEEIAVVTGVSRETVKSRLRYAVKKLKDFQVE